MQTSVSCRLGRSASSTADEISYLSGEIGSCTCCASSSRTRLKEEKKKKKGVRMRWKEGARPQTIYVMRFGFFHRPETRVAFNGCSLVRTSEQKSCKFYKAAASVPPVPFFFKSVLS